MGRRMPHEQDAENVFDYGNSYAQVEKELEQYDLVPSYQNKSKN